MDKDVKNYLIRLIDEVKNQTKEILNTAEAADFLGISKSYLYKLTANREIPFYKPNGKLTYFSRADLTKWLTAHRMSSTDELSGEALTYCMKGGMK